MKYNDSKFTVKDLVPVGNEGSLITEQKNGFFEIVKKGKLNHFFLEAFDEIYKRLSRFVSTLDGRTFRKESLEACDETQLKLLLDNISVLGYWADIPKDVKIEFIINFYKNYNNITSLKSIQDLIKYIFGDNSLKTNITFTSAYEYELDIDSTKSQEIIYSKYTQARLLEFVNNLTPAHLKLKGINHIETSNDFDLKISPCKSTGVSLETTQNTGSITTYPLGYTIDLDNALKFVYLESLNYLFLVGTIASNSTNFVVTLNRQNPPNYSIRYDEVCFTDPNYFGTQGLKVDCHVVPFGVYQNTQDGIRSYTNIPVSWTSNLDNSIDTYTFNLTSAPFRQAGLTKYLMIIPRSGLKTDFNYHFMVPNQMWFWNTGGSGNNQSIKWTINYMVPIIQLRDRFEDLKVVPRFIDMSDSNRQCNVAYFDYETQTITTPSDLNLYRFNCRDGYYFLSRPSSSTSFIASLTLPRPDVYQMSESQYVVPCYDKFITTLNSTNPQQDPTTQACVDISDNAFLAKKYFWGYRGLSFIKAYSTYIIGS